MFGLSIPAVVYKYIAGILCIATGLAFFIRTPAIVNEFKIIISGHRRILTMALVIQGLFIFFIGAVTIILATIAPFETSDKTISFFSAGILVLISLWTISTGARSEDMLLRISHFLSLASAALLLLGNVPSTY